MSDYKDETRARESVEAYSTVDVSFGNSIEKGFLLECANIFAQNNEVALEKETAKLKERVDLDLVTSDLLVEVLVCVKKRKDKGAKHWEAGPDFDPL